MTQKRFHRFQHRDAAFPDRYDVEPSYTAKPRGIGTGVRLTADFSPEIWAPEKTRLVAFGHLFIIFHGRRLAGVAIEAGGERFVTDLAPWFEHALAEGATA